jgi:hypothetical protein
MFASRAESRQPEVSSHITDYSVHVRETALLAIQKGNRPLYAQESKKCMGKHLAEAFWETQAKCNGHS